MAKVWQSYKHLKTGYYTGKCLAPLKYTLHFMLYGVSFKKKKKKRIVFFSHLSEDFCKPFRAVFIVHTQVCTVGAKGHTAMWFENSIHFFHELWHIKPVGSCKSSNKVHRAIFKWQIFCRAHTIKEK